MLQAMRLTMHAHLCTYFVRIGRDLCSHAAICRDALLTAKELFGICDMMRQAVRMQSQVKAVKAASASQRVQRAKVHSGNRHMISAGSQRIKARPGPAR